MATIVSIGRNLPTGGTLSEEEWAKFGTDTLRTVRAYAGEVFFYGTGAGIYGDEREESVTIVAGRVPNVDRIQLEQDLARLADTFGQECIAVTYGRTTFAYASTGG